MRPLLMLLALGLALAGCAAPPGNELNPNGGGPAAGPGNGVVLFGTASSQEVPPVYWAIDIRRLDHSGRPEPATSSAGTANSITFDQFGAMHDRSAPFGAYSVLPGEYAVVRMAAQQVGGMFLDYDHRAAGAQAVAMGPTGLLAYAVLGTAAASERAAEEARFGPRAPSPLNFLNSDGALRAEAPRFSVRAGEIVYLGEFLFGATRYFDERIEPGTAGGRGIRTIVSPFVENAVDLAAARAAQTRLGLAAWPMRTAQPSVLARGPVFVAPSMSRDRVEWLSAGTVVGEETARARGTPTPKLAAPADRADAPSAPGPSGDAADLSAVDRRELQQRFLAGEITVEQYRSATSRP